MRDEFTLLLAIILLIVFLAIGIIAILVDIYLVLDSEIFSVSHSTGFISYLSKCISTQLNIQFYTLT